MSSISAQDMTLVSSESSSETLQRVSFRLPPAVPKIAIAIPTYNRAQNIALALHAIAKQKPGMQVAVWDDGSTDKNQTFNAVSGYGDRGELDIRYGRHSHNGYRVSLNRNRAVKLLGSDVTHVWFVDSDVVLNQKAIAHGEMLVKEHPEQVVVGKYIWLPPMKISISDLDNKWDDFINARLPPLSVEYKENIVNIDPRSASLWDCPNKNKPIGGIALGGNLIVPMAAFNDVGGYDENIEGQGQDCDFGRALHYKGYRCICCDHIIGYHASHYRDTAWCSSSVQQTIAYMAEKYGTKEDVKH